MKKNISKKINCQKIKSNLRLDRIDEIKQNIKNYYESIDLLFAFASGEKTLKNKNHSFRQKRTKEDNQYMHETMINLLYQIQRLQKELRALKMEQY